MASGRVRFNRFLKGEPMGRPAFVPLIRGLPARIDGTPFEALTASPTLWANSLSKTVELFNLDGVVMGFMFSLLAEACGCQIAWKGDRPIIQTTEELTEDPMENERLKNAMEAASRLFAVLKNERACVAALTGPVTLASQLFGRSEGPKRVAEVKKYVARVTEAFCETRPDVIIFMEGRPLAQADIGTAHRRIYNTLKNILSYYNVRSGLYLQGYPLEDLGRFKALGTDMYVLGPSRDGSLPPLSGLWSLGEDALGVGLGLPLNDPDRAREIMAEGADYYRMAGGRGFFFTSFGPVTRDTNLETLHQVVRDIDQIRL